METMHTYVGEKCMGTSRMRIGKGARRGALGKIRPSRDATRPVRMSEELALFMGDLSDNARRCGCVRARARAQFRETFG